MINEEESSTYNNYNTDDLIDEEESSTDNNYNTDDLIDEEDVSGKAISNEAKKRLDKERHFGEKRRKLDYINIARTLRRNFLKTFLYDNPRYDRRLEYIVKEKYYSSSIYKSLLNLDIDSFLSKRPAFQKLTISEEKNLFEKRLLLSTYYDSLRYYNQLPYIKEFQEFCNGSKSYADRVYNQQFKGTMKIVRKLFSITVDPEKNTNTNENPVLKFDQPLYLNSNESNYKPFHEELSHKKVQKTHFLEISNSTPFYAGWDQGLRKLVITNRLLGRSFAGYALYSPTKMKGKEYQTLANFIDSNKKIEFTTWPLSKLTLEKENKSYSNIPYNVLFESLKDPKNQPLSMRLSVFFALDTADPVKNVPSSLPRALQDPQVVFPSNPLTTIKKDILIKDILPPNKGGFIWPGNSPLNFHFASKFKK